MRIFIEPPYLGGSADQSGRQAFEVLREAGSPLRDSAALLTTMPSCWSIYQMLQRRSRCSESLEFEPSWIRLFKSPYNQPISRKRMRA